MNGSTKDACETTTRGRGKPVGRSRREKAATNRETAKRASSDRTLLDFYRSDSPDLFRKCSLFGGKVRELEAQGIVQTMYRVTLESGLDHRITVRDPHRSHVREMICFDSNSYLGLHLHPRVVSAVHRALDDVGYGTPSAQVLCGTNRYLRKLEDTVSRFHGREATMIFPSGYAANLGVLTALVREKDLVVRDRFSHASIHDGCRATGSKFLHVYPHDDLVALEAILTGAADGGGVAGKLIVTDGVFSMHGRVARLPELVAIARRHGAKLLVDDAHGTGVLGPHGRGIEDLYGMGGSVDLLVGTFSKAAGALGGYLCGRADVISYLRFYANPGMFTAALPAALCAGIATAYTIMEEEPEHRARLWNNVRKFVPALKQAGLAVSGGESPILTIFVGSNDLLWQIGRELFDEGVKCGFVSYPAVPVGEAVLRLAVNARHTDEDLARTVEILARLARKYGLQNKTPEEIRALGGHPEPDEGGLS
jgi:7-keto-8-aminopelargonate synthetase-like enzyme